VAAVTRPIAGYRLWIFDADGTLRRTTVPGQPCPRAQHEWVLLPGVRDLLQAVRWDGPGEPRLGIASNQDQVGAGLIPATMARQLLRELARSAAGVDLPEPAIQLCPHALGVACQCRKPRPGMLQRIMGYYGIGPGATVFVGDNESDRAAARAAAVAFIEARDLFGWSQSA
jgi:D-glycero-D-manno-heptose 1,7-bisphosphate phosphatase